MTSNTWTKTGHSEYTRPDGATIRKSATVANWWEYRNSNGDRVQCPDGEGGYLANIWAAATTLKTVKLLAEDLTPDAPVYA